MFDYKQAMDKVIQQEVESGSVNGAVTLVLHRGKEIYFNAFGYADKEKEIPMRRDTIFHMYSMTKPIMAAAVMILAERGELDLWAPVSQYLPAFANQKVWCGDGKVVPVERDSTIWDMLHMTSGIPYPDLGNEPGRQMDTLFRELIGRREKGERVDTQEYLRRIAEIPLVFQPGEKWMYGLSADVLGGVVEAVTGKTLGAFLKEELFQPLGMKDTAFYVRLEDECRLATRYRWNEQENKLLPFHESHLGEYYKEDVAFESGGAGLVSTIDDYSHFAQMMIHGGEYNGKQILGKKTIELMTRDALSDFQKQDYNWDSLLGYGYGCLMRVLIDPVAAMSNASIGEFGWDGWTGNYVTMDPADDMVLLYFIQRCDGAITPALRKIRMMTYAAIEG